MIKKYDRKKENIITEAKKVFLNLGYEKTTMDDIAKKIGLRKNTLYYYFENKEELFNEAMKEDMENIADCIFRAVNKVETSGSKVKVYLRTISEATFARAQMYTVSAKILLEIMVISEKTGNKTVDKFLRLLSDILKEGVRKKEFVKHNCDEFALVLLDLVMSYNYTQMSKVIYNIIDNSEIKGEKCCDLILNKGVNYLLKGIKVKK